MSKNYNKRKLNTGYSKSKNKYYIPLPLDTDAPDILSSRAAKRADKKYLSHILHNIKVPSMKNTIQGETKIYLPSLPNLRNDERIRNIGLFSLRSRPYFGVQEETQSKTNSDTPFIKQKNKSSYSMGTNILRTEYYGKIPGLVTEQCYMLTKVKHIIPQSVFKTPIYIDLETSGLNPHTSDVLSLSITVLNSDIQTLGDFMSRLFHNNNIKDTSYDSYLDDSYNKDIARLIIDHNKFNENYFTTAIKNKLVNIDWYVTDTPNRINISRVFVDVNTNKEVSINGSNFTFNSMSKLQYAIMFRALQLSGATLIGHNMKFDLKFMMKYIRDYFPKDIGKEGELFDPIMNSMNYTDENNYKTDNKKLYPTDFNIECTQIRNSVINRGKVGKEFTGNALAVLAKRYLGYTMDKQYQKYWIDRPSGNDPKHFPNINAVRYAAYDTILLALINRNLRSVSTKIKDNALKAQINEHLKFEFKVLPYIAATELYGIGLDKVKWKKQSIDNELELEEIKYDLQDAINKATNNKYISKQVDMFGLEEFTLNLDSPKQMLDFFNTDLKLSIDSTTKDALSKITYVDIVDKFITYKKKAKEVSTYGIDFLSNVNPVTNRIHTSFYQMAVTGRLKSSKPNIQNIPRDNKYRNCFIAAEDHTLVIADYSSQESRILTYLSREPNLMNFYNDPALSDLHSYVARLLFPDTVGKVSISDVKTKFPIERQMAKSAGFALNYGGDGHTIAKNLGIDVSLGLEVEKAYFKAFPGLKDYFKKGYNSAIEKGYIIIPQAGIIHLPEYEKYKNFTSKANKYTLSEYSLDWIKKQEIIYKGMALNFPIQGTAAIMTKLADYRINTSLSNKPIDAFVVSYIHDEIIVECNRKDENMVTQIVKEAMEYASYNFILKTIPVDIFTSTYWKK